MDTFGLADASPETVVGDEIVPAWQGKFVQQSKQAAAIVQQGIDDLREQVLGDVLTAIATMWGAAEGIDISLDVSHSVQTTGEMRCELAEILHQALRNVGRRTHVSWVRVVLRTGHERLALSVMDNGDGLPQAEEAPVYADAGCELSRIAARACRLGGSLFVKSWPGRGNCLMIQAPMPALVGEASPSRLRTPTLRIAISNGDSVVRSGLRAPLAQMADVEAVAEVADAVPGPDLTRREWEILRLIAEGLRNRQIAARLMISPKTVKNHIWSIYKQIGVNERSQAVNRWQELHQTDRAIARLDSERQAGITNLDSPSQPFSPAPPPLP